MYQQLQLIKTFSFKHSQEDEKSELLNIKFHRDNKIMPPPPSSPSHPLNNINTKHYNLESHGQNYEDKARFHHLTDLKVKHLLERFELIFLG